MERHIFPPKSLHTLIALLLVLSIIIQSGTSLKTIKARIVVKYHDQHASSKSEQSGGEMDKTTSNKLVKPTTHSNVEVLSNQPDSDFVLNQDTLHGTIFLECVASYPIQWVYEGPGYPNVETYAETRRAFTKFNDPSTYLYFAKIHLVKIEEENTGKYSCRSLADDKAQVFYYIFVPGPKFFVAESMTQAIQGKAYEDTITIPCAISHKNNVTAELFKVGAMNHPDHISMATFDPKIGFNMETKYLKDDPWGTYICTCGNESLTNSIMIDILPPKQFLLRPTVKGNYVYQDEKIKQRFICEAKRNITLEFSPGLQNGGRRSKISYRYDEDTDLPFIASLEAEPLEFANYSLISCILNDIGLAAENSTDFARKRNPLYHTWEYSVYGNNKNLTFTYSKKLDSFLCCSANSYVTPSMSHFRPCTSLQECQLRNYRHEKQLRLDMINYSLLSPEVIKIIQHYSDPASKIPEHRLPVGCTGLKRYESDHDGFFRCSIPAAPAPLTLPLSQMEMNVQDFFYSSLKGKPILSFQELTSNEEIIVMTIGNSTSSTNHKPMFKVNEEVEVSCRTNTFFFSKGHQWTFQRGNGSVELVPSDLMREEVTQIQGISRKISLIKFPDTDITHISCHAPCWYSSEWRNFSLEVKIIS